MNAVVELGKDLCRETSIFFDELMENEMRKSVKQHGLILDENDIEKAINNIGFNTATLN